MPSCPECGSDMIIKTARRGRNAGGQFYGCSQYQVQQNDIIEWVYSCDLGSDVGR